MDRGRVDLLQGRQDAENRAVGPLAGEGSLQGVYQTLTRRFRIVDVVGEIAVCQVIEGDSVSDGRTADQHRTFFAQCVADAELVKDVGVMNGHIADDDVGFDDEGEHVGADIAGLDNLACRAAAKAHGLQGRLDETSADALEINLAAGAVFLFAEGTNDECALHRVFLRQPAFRVGQDNQ